MKVNFFRKNKVRTVRDELVNKSNDNIFLNQSLLKCGLIWLLFWGLLGVFKLLNILRFKSQIIFSNILDLFIYLLPYLFIFAVIIIFTILLWRINREDKGFSISATLIFILSIVVGMLISQIVFEIGHILSFSNMILTTLIPFAFVPLVVTMLIGKQAGIVAGLCFSSIITVIFDEDFRVLLVGLLVSGVAVYLAYRVHRRAEFLKIALIIGAIVSICFILFTLNRDVKFFDILLKIVYSFGGSFFAVICFFFFLPIFERMFRVSSDLSLLELADMEHPILKRLAEDAPGTYHHSLMVASLTQAAVNAIGGNGLKAAVCAYFHDIGKLIKPEFFVENIQTEANPHDDLTPSMSALVIISHVKEGVDLASKYKLPIPIIEAIEQHHGTSLVQFFYHKAKQLQKENDLEEVKEETFRYPGPKPLSKENAVLSLADAVEAVSRSLEKVTPANIEDIVNEIVDNKIKDGQLDSSELTFSDISKIKRTFILTLGNMLHTRISYPSLDENRNNQSTETDKN